MANSTISNGLARATTLLPEAARSKSEAFLSLDMHDHKSLPRLPGRAAEEVSQEASPHQAVPKGAQNMAGAPFRKVVQGCMNTCGVTCDRSASGD